MQDVRQIVRLVADVAVLNGSLPDKRRSLLQGLGELIKADAWIWGIGQHCESGSQPEYACIVKEGFSAEQFARVLVANEHPDMKSLCAPLFAEFAARQKSLTRRRDQIVDDYIYDSSDVSNLWKEAGVGPVILSFHPLKNGGASAIALYRHHNQPAFSHRDSRIAHVILGEVSWLHFDIREIDTPRYRLSPRLRQVLNFLIQGSSRKEVAAHLEISIHTVSGYCKELYEKFGVRSQAELVRRFSHGDGGDIG